MARVFVEVFIENVWKPFNRAGRPEEEWPKVRDALERLRPLASEALLAIFQQVMSEAVEEATARDIQRSCGEPARARSDPSRRGGGADANVAVGAPAPQVSSSPTTMGEAGFEPAKA